MATNNIIDFTTIEDAIAEAFQVYATTLHEYKGMIYIYMDKETNEVKYSLKDTFKNKDYYLYLCSFTRYPSSNNYDAVLEWDKEIAWNEFCEYHANDCYDEAKENLMHNNYLPVYYTIL